MSKTAGIKMLPYTRYCSVDGWIFSWPESFSCFFFREIFFYTVESPTSCVHLRCPPETKFLLEVKKSSNLNIQPYPKQEFTEFYGYRVTI